MCGWPQRTSGAIEYRSGAALGLGVWGSFMIIEKIRLFSGKAKFFELVVF